MLAPSPQISPTLNPAVGAATQDSLARARDAKPSTLPVVAARDTPPAPRPAPTETLTLSAQRPAVDPAAPSPVYAEVWKDGVKVAAIDTHGTVTSFAGPVATPAGSASGGPWLAAVRAAQVAQAVGGEIRINGLTVDSGTLRTRARLELAYGK